MRRYRSARTGLWAAAGALLVGAPGVLAAAGARDLRVLGAAALMAPIATVFAGVALERHKRVVQRRDEHAVKLTAGTLAPGGRLPRVRDLDDPIALGVHPAPAGAGAAAAPDRVPVYVPRDIDEELRRAIAGNGFVLLVGDSTAGKSRAAFEAMRAVLPDHTLIVPADRAALCTALEEAGDTRRCVLWLNDLERYLGTGGLTRTAVAALLSGEGRHRVILATMRATEEEQRYAHAGEATEDTRQLQREDRDVLDQVTCRIGLERLFTPAERERAGALTADDPRIADALAHAETYGIAEYLACGPELLRAWGNAWAKAANPRGAALITAAVDCRRAGHRDPLPRVLLEELHTGYLEAKGGGRLHPESLDRAWAWATELRPSGNALLYDIGGERYEVFDYLTDSVQRRTPAGEYVPEDTLTTILAHANSAGAQSIAFTAYLQGRYRIAEQAFRQSHDADRDQLGPEHPVTLTERGNLAVVLSKLGRLDDAETELRAVLETCTRALGPDHPATLNSQSNLATVLSYLGRLEEAEAEHRIALDTRVQVLGHDHPDTLTSRNNIAMVLSLLGRLEEAEAEHRAALEAFLQKRGHDHPDTLHSRNNLATVLGHLGRLEEAEAEHRAVLGARVGMLGPGHPDTVISRNNLASILWRLGRLEEAEAEHRTALETFERALGPDHPSTLTCRNNVASVLLDMGRPAEAEAELRATLEASSRVLGPDHPSTLACRDNLGAALYELGRLEEAESEHLSVVKARVRVLGPDHPDTLASGGNLVSVMVSLGRLGQVAGQGPGAGGAFTIDIPLTEDDEDAGGG